METVLWTIAERKWTISVTFLVFCEPRFGRKKQILIWIIKSKKIFFSEEDEDEDEDEPDKPKRVSKERLLVSHFALFFSIV